MTDRAELKKIVEDYWFGTLGSKDDEQLVDDFMDWHIKHRKEWLKGVLPEKKKYLKPEDEPLADTKVMNYSYYGFNYCIDGIKGRAGI